MNQQTLNNSYTFTGKGLHTGRLSTIVIKPAPVNYGIRFHRVDISSDAVVRAYIGNAAQTNRSTSIEENGAKVITTEHLLSALVGLNVDNAIIEINAEEVPILDGSALPYVEAISKDGLKEQDAPRSYFEVKDRIVVELEGSDSRVEVEPCDHFEIDLTIDFNSQVVGVQRFVYSDRNVNYSTEIAPCRTFCFFHELEFLLANNLIKGGDMDNAIVIVERDVNEQVLDKMRSLFGVSTLSVKRGYLNHLKLHFDNEIVRHKVLDIIGDFALVGAPIKGRIKAYKSGHGINTIAAKKMVGIE